uniref:Uncharacterized protein n=1 Tax=Anguilla anguilla TaxID=7936 RepID=A0A0E9W0Y0_ANGAN
MFYYGTFSEFHPREELNAWGFRTLTGAF